MRLYHEYAIAAACEVDLRSRYTCGADQLSCTVPAIDARRQRSMSDKRDARLKKLGVNAGPITFSTVFLIGVVVAIVIAWLLY
ncbi:hypothetical protein CU103_27355 [Phyllobacterium sophorae]|uniref:Uncharacterized protein n=1 Tax=Phyllobacterium sophorae TaxID=1520277 RepID=A0A2P7AXQ5_9HYPH|nr:hypothetical protein CU103_27355 [Phyllobacterium sophorae]